LNSVFFPAALSGNYRQILSIFQKLKLRAMFVALRSFSRDVLGCAVRFSVFNTRDGHAPNRTLEREMENIERIRPPAEPLPRPFAIPLDRDEAEETRSTSEAKTETRVQLVEAEARIFQARLSYDAEHAEVFIEILNPTTGDVIRRLPAEKAAEDRSVFGHGGALIDRVA
jgi:hypothetical protein